MAGWRGRRPGGYPFTVGPKYGGRRVRVWDDLMCIFSQPVDHVGSTRIFVSDLGHDVHGTAYQMAFRAPEPVAMILPVPVLKGTGDDALAFIDLGGYPKFFDDLDRCFPTPPSLGKWRGGGYGVGDVGELRRLAVHEVGDYVASYVP